MRGSAFVVVFSLAVLFPKMGNAQAFQAGSPIPEVTAGTAVWLARNEPIIVGGLVYYPTREQRMFDPGVMVMSGVYQGVPVYADVTQLPFSILYVPLTRTNMTSYERKREGDIAGTTASRTPAFPVDVASDIEYQRVERQARQAIIARAIAAGGASEAPAAVGTTGTIVAPQPAPAAGTIDRARPQRTIVQMIPTPQRATTNGVWLEFSGARWYADGTAVSFSIDRFEPIGDYRGFPVYREKNGRSNAIWVSVVKDGPVAPYAKR
jgi:hypothetical protein